uniref:Ribonuclease H-like domain-containing protein n=1 Tax=Tanacetum cinerariifolium TaxID=118510 RepID=A0A699HWL3_TANCI|nr:ribonuclease H-like domain-containing protein [Tanacetum cinerariifolium]
MTGTHNRSNARGRGTQDTANINELLIKLLQHLEDLGVSAHRNSPSPNSGGAFFYHAGLTILMAHHQHTWHQRLGHPGSEVLRRFVSFNFISCTKEKPLVLCHACQLGKHVRLPFVSSSTIISSCFGIIHSDV